MESKTEHRPVAKRGAEATREADQVAVSPRRRPDVQGLRAVAILLVVGYHGRFGVSSGFVGVDVFFVISGFVITWTLVRELERRDAIAIGAFYGRRVRRLLPALAVMLVFVATIGALLVPIAALRMSALTEVAASVFGANWYLYSLPGGYFDPAATLDPLLHTWTLGVEEQFYLLYPVVLLGSWWLGCRLGRSTGRGVAIVAVATVCAVSFGVAESFAGGAFAFYASPARGWEFGAGCLAALLPVWGRMPRLVLAALGAIGVTAIAVIAVGPVAGGPAAGGVATLLVPVLGATALLLAGSGDNLISEILSAKPFTFVGDLSYSWYLWHWPLIVFAVALFPNAGWAARSAAIVSLLLAWASLRYVENPIRFNSAMRGRKLVTVGAACVAAPLLAGLLLLHLRVTNAQAAGGARHADVQRHCDRPSPLGSRARVGCVWRKAGSRGTVVLIGDSNAGHFTEPVVAASQSLDLNAVVATYSSCPFVQLRLGRGYQSCERFDRESLRWLIAHPPRLVIIGIRADTWIERSGYILATRRGPWATTPDAKRRLWSTGLRSEIAVLNDAGVRVVIVHPVPRVPSSPQGCATILVLLNHCSSSESRASVDLYLRRTLAAETAAVRGLNASVLILENQLCSRSSCRSTRDGVITYRDEQHLSIAGSQLLTPVFRRVINA